jgi:hypothetical protein
MKKASWILLAVVAAAITLLSLVSAVHAYRTSDDYGIGGLRVSKVAGGDAGLATALRGIRGTSAAYGAAYGEKHAYASILRLGLEPAPRLAQPVATIVNISILRRCRARSAGAVGDLFVRRAVEWRNAHKTNKCDCRN